MEDFVEGRSADDYADNPLVRSAVERQLEIVGEALSQALRLHPGVLDDEIPEAPRIIALRNRLAHGYASVADDVVWAIVQSEVPALRCRADALLGRMREDDRRPVRSAITKDRTPAIDEDPRPGFDPEWSTHSPCRSDPRLNLGHTSAPLPPGPGRARTV